MAQATNTSKDETGKFKKTAEEAAEEVRTGAHDLADYARDKAGEFAQDARARAEAYGEEQKNYAADETSKVAEALRKAASDLSDGSPQERIFGQLASGVADFADSMREKSVVEMGHDLNEVARRNPAAFLGGAALLGFAAGRFLKASSRHDDDLIADYEDDRPVETPPADARPAPVTDLPS
ncbi:hypothetical protein E0K89_006480 [Aquicoccus sp. SCR17]|nr:hypothetical protein [Carideicomes alvinocaridis]